MNKLIYFNPRLTDKLNAIYKHPFTVASGSAGSGKTFALHNYLSATKAKALWHVSEGTNVNIYIREFIDNLSECCDGMAELRELIESSASPSDMAIRIASVLKHTCFERTVYILDYKGEDLPDEIFEFLYYLSGQRITGLYTVLLLRNSDKFQNKGHLDFNINYIPEEYFLLSPKEIGDAFFKNGISLGLQEIQWLYLLSGGWIVAVDAFFKEIKEKGKSAAYQNIEKIAERLFAFSGNNELRTICLSSHKNDSLNLTHLSEVCQYIDKYDTENARFALAKEELNAEKFSKEWDACTYYRASLLALDGYAGKAQTLLEEEFALRINRHLQESAYRILVYGLQLRVLLQGKWYEEEKEIIGEFVRSFLSDNKENSKRMVGITLYLEKEYYKLIALLETSEFMNEDDLSYKEFLLAAAYKETGHADEMNKHLALGCQSAFETGRILPALLFFGYFPNNIRSDDQEFRKKVLKFRRAEKKNNDGHFDNTKKALTVREHEIVDYVIKGMTNKEIAGELNISENTVKVALKTVFKKLGISSRKELI